MNILFDHINNEEVLSQEALESMLELSRGMSALQPRPSFCADPLLQRSEERTMQPRIQFKWIWSQTGRQNATSGCLV